MKQNSWRSAYNKNQLGFKIGISILFLGFGFILIFSQSFSVIPDVSDNNIDTSVTEKNLKLIPSDFTDSPNKEINQIHPKVTNFLELNVFPGNCCEDDKTGKCDIFSGDWIPSPDGSPYTNNSCRWIGSDQNCLTSGRPDTGYLYWRWKPKACDLPRFDPKKFLEMMRDKSWGFVGDSITRNHLQSFICILSQVEDAVDISDDKNCNKNQKWHFPSSNLTVSVIWSPFLAKTDTNGVQTSEIQLHIDILDKTWTELFDTWDYVLFSSGKWFIKETIYYENNTILGCHGCQDKNHTDPGFNVAYRKVINKLFDFILNSNRQKTVIYRTSTPDHFENGMWSNGGRCDRSVPTKEGEFEMGLLNRILREVELPEFEKAEARASEKGKKLKLLDVMPLSLQRPDGHPGAYRHFYPFAKDKNAKVQYDCLHWCLPGPIDRWNDLLMKLVVDG